MIPAAERIPPGQTLTQKFPVTGEKAASEVLTDESWRLRICGAVADEVILSFGDLLTLPQETFEADIHCVTGWSQLGMRFEGVRLSTVLEQVARVSSRARYVRFVAYSDRGHDTSLPLEIALADSWLIHRVDSEPLTPEHGFPVRVVTPSRYFYKSLKWLKEVVLLEEDQLGFWERTSGYHNVGDPWKEERLEGTRFTSSAESTAFRDLTDFETYRGEGAENVIVKANLRDWKPRTSRLAGLRLKACDFRGADLRGVDFSGANLTLGKFHGARLEGADFRDADLEGADFSGASLAGALMDGNALSATVFQSSDGKGLASHEGLTMTKPQGLLEAQEIYLREIGVL